MKRLKRQLPHAITAASLLLVALAITLWHSRPPRQVGEGVPAEVRYADGRVEHLTWADVLREAARGRGRAYLESGPHGGWRYRDERGVWGQVHAVAAQAAAD